MRKIFARTIIVGLIGLGAAPTGWAGSQMANPCAAQNPCAAANPCAAKQPCAAVQPCGALQMPMKPATARYVIGHVASVNPAARILALKVGGQSVIVSVDQRTAIKQGGVKKALTDLRPGDKVTVSVVERDGKRRAAYVYIAQAAAQPCAANPCAAKQPCAVQPCAAKQPCAPKQPCGVNPCAAKNPCAPKW